MIFQTRVASAPVTAGSSFQPPSRPRLQRKCACGGTPGPTGECEDCKRKRLSLQTKLAINQPGDRYEQEADRVAEAVVSGAASNRPSISSLGNGNAVQREDPAKPKTEEEKYKEAAKKVGEAFLETAPGKEIKKKAEELGDAFIATLPGKIITGAAVAGAVATLAATHKELPIGIPEIPLDKIKPGLKMKITYEGPVDKPTKVMATFSFTLGAGKAREKKPALTESEKFRAETARMATEQAKFREGLKTDEEKAAEKRMLDAYLRSRMLSPGQLTPRPSPLSFGLAGEQLGFHPGVPSSAPRSSLGPWAPDIKLTGETQAEEPKKKEEETVQRKASSDREVSGAPPIVDDVLQSSGQPLDSATRGFMEDRFGYDFGKVRVHQDARADASARAVNALAYTVGRDVVFGTGQYAPTTIEGRKLIVHELTHVVQQSTGSAKARHLQRKPAPGPAKPTLEESDKSWIRAFGLRKWLKGIISDWRDIQARYEAATASTFHPTEALLMGILTASRSRIDLGEDQIKTELNGDPPLLKEFRDAYRKMISVVVPKFASLTGKTATEVFQAHRQEIPEWALPATTGATSSKTAGCKTLSFADFNGTPPSGATKAAETDYDYTPKTIKAGDTVTAVFDSASSWAQARFAHPTDRKATGLDKQVSDCKDFLKKNPGGSWDGPTATPPICAAAPPFPNTAGITAVADCDPKIGVAIEKWQSAESPRLLKHEQFHMNLACTLADKATKALASGKDPGTVAARLMAQDKAATGDYDNHTNHGCKAAEQTKWEGLITGGLTKYPIP
jgi:hypothetical protein